jgi:DNA repair exonuclease SbcCD nuclease subunit
LNKVRILFVSDIHLAHPIVSSSKICRDLRTYLFPRLKDTDILILGGDIFDGNVSLNDAAARESLSFISELLYLLDKYSVYTVIVRGTVSHDRNQCHIFKTLHGQCQYTNELVYKETLSYIYVNKFDLNLVVVPDDLPYKSTKDAMDAIYELYTSIGRPIDYMAIHGYFKHQIRQDVPRLPRICFDVNDFPFVSRYIFTGHEHKGGQYKKVLTNGSFDRLSHGSPEPKGFLYVCDDGKDATIEFVENKDASVFETLDFRGKCDVQDMYNDIDDLLKNISTEDDIHLRFIVDTNKFNATLNTYMRQKYAHIMYKFKYNSVDIEEEYSPPSLDYDELALVQITRETLPTHICNFLNDKGIHVDLSEIHNALLCKVV